MPAPLLDRMEVIELPGYTSEEKLNIAMLHLLPRVLEQHGITDDHIHIPTVRKRARAVIVVSYLILLVMFNDSVFVVRQTSVELIIQRYTREAGVRNLGRHLASLARAAAVEVAKKQQCKCRQSEVLHTLDHGGELLLEGSEVEALDERGTLADAMKSKPLVVDEAVLELVLGVGLSSLRVFIVLNKNKNEQHDVRNHALSSR